MDRRTHHDPLPIVDPCPIPGWTGEPCGERSHPAAPFAICGRHARQVWDSFNRIIDNSRADGMSQAVFILNEHAANERKRAKEIEDSQGGTVYYVQIGEHIKIGYTTNLPQRMAQYPPNRRVLATERGGWDRESQRHCEFRHLLDMGKEWFRVGPDLIAHINDLRAEQGAKPLRVAA